QRPCHAPDPARVLRARETGVFILDRFEHHRDISMLSVLPSAHGRRVPVRLAALPVALAVLLASGCAPARQAFHGVWPGGDGPDADSDAGASATAAAPERRAPPSPLDAPPGRRGDVATWTDA